MKLSFWLSLPVFFCSAVSLLAAPNICIHPVEIDKKEVAEDRSFSLFGKMIPVETAKLAFLDLGSGIPTLRLDEESLAEAVEPPLDEWNKLLPNVVFQDDGDIWAYTTVRPALYRLDASLDQFVRHPVSDTPHLKGFTRSDWRRRHENRSLNERARIGSGDIFVQAQNELFVLNDGNLEQVSVPRGWKGSMSAPIHVSGLGFFIHIEGDIWFRPQGHADWQLVVEAKDLLSLYSQSPFSMFQGHHDPETHEVWLLLEDRVYVGNFDADAAKLIFDYQFAGDIVIHQPTGQVLVWAGDPLTKKTREWPEAIVADRGIWEMTSKKPTLVSGYPASARLSDGGSVPLLSYVFHGASGLTITNHSNGFALFDGKEIRDMPAMARVDGQTFFLKTVGGRVFAKSHDRLIEITDALEVEEIELPEDPSRLFDLAYSEILNGFILFSEGWEFAYFTEDFEDFERVGGANEPIKNVLGDLHFMEGLAAHSNSELYILKHCS